MKCLLALKSHASYLIFVHRLTDSLYASSPRSVTLTQLRFTSLAVVSSREDFHLQDHAHAGRTLYVRAKASASLRGEFSANCQGPGKDLAIPGLKHQAPSGISDLQL